jgi:DNA (cytosine-5)-methyltransferase 1
VIGEGYEQHPLRRADRPAFEDGAFPYKVVDLFSGCGGLSLGIAQALRAAGRALEIRLAVGFELAAATVYRANFPNARHVERSSVEDVFDGALGAAPTAGEVDWTNRIGPVHALVGGPPCQGHSTLNNHTRGTDPKNALYMYMTRAAEVLHPEVVMIENVPAVLNDRFAGRNVVEAARLELVRLDYRVAHGVIPVHGLGVAQTRKRHILLATKGEAPAPSEVLGAILDQSVMHDVRWAIGDLEFATAIGVDSRPKASGTNLQRMTYLLENDEYDLPNHLRPECHQGKHSYKSMYGRLRWDRPAQTITSGFGSIGQGRYMHPSQLRALTPHEAARLQGFPDYFDFSSVTTRAALATMIGNAVPPQLSAAVFRELIRSEASESHVEPRASDLVLA